jgi:hypothetical protein
MTVAVTVLRCWVERMSHRRARQWVGSNIAGYLSPSPPGLFTDPFLEQEGHRMRIENVH